MIRVWLVGLLLVGWRVNSATPNKNFKEFIDEQEIEEEMRQLMTSASRTSSEMESDEEKEAFEKMSPEAQAELRRLKLDPFSRRQPVLLRTLNLNFSEVGASTVQIYEKSLGDSNPSKKLELRLTNEALDMEEHKIGELRYRYSNDSMFDIFGFGAEAFRRKAQPLPHAIVDNVEIIFSWREHGLGSLLLDTFLNLTYSRLGNRFILNADLKEPPTEMRAFIYGYKYWQPATWRLFRRTALKHNMHMFLINPSQEEIEGWQTADDLLSPYMQSILPRRGTKLFLRSSSLLKRGIDHDAETFKSLLENTTVTFAGLSIADMNTTMGKYKTLNGTELNINEKDRTFPSKELAGALVENQQDVDNRREESSRYLEELLHRTNSTQFLEKFRKLKKLKEKEKRRLEKKYNPILQTGRIPGLLDQDSDQESVDMNEFIEYSLNRENNLDPGSDENFLKHSTSSSGEEKPTRRAAPSVLTPDYSEKQPRKFENKRDYKGLSHSAGIPSKRKADNFAEDQDEIFGDEQTSSDGSERKVPS